VPVNEHDAAPPDPPAEDGGGGGTAFQDPTEIVTFTEADVQGDDSYYSGGVARKLFDWVCPEGFRVFTLVAPVPVAGISRGLEVQLFKASADVPAGVATYGVDYDGYWYADWYNGNDVNGAQFDPDTFYSDVETLATDGSPHSLTPGQSYQVWIGNYFPDVGGQVDIGFLKRGLFPGTAWEPLAPPLEQAVNRSQGLALEGSNNFEASAAHAEGSSTQAIGSLSHAEGYGTKALGGFGSHAENYQSIASGPASHAEGSGHAEGDWSHAEGFSRAVGNYSHSEGIASLARWYGSHAAAVQNFELGFPNPASYGQAQYERLPLLSVGNQVLGSYAGSGMLLPPSMVAVFHAQVVSEGAGGTKVKAWNVVGVVRTDGAGAHSLIGTPTVTELADLGASGFTLAVGADDDYGVTLHPGGSPDRSAGTIHYTELAVQL
jgi:hypothetical protein